MCQTVIQLQEEKGLYHSNLEIYKATGDIINDHKYRFANVRILSQLINLEESKQNA